MRWNCPHCEELVTAGIDFENTKKAYVRCANCNGMALIHRSAALADYVRARRMEEEAQLEAEHCLTQTASANSRIQAMESQIRGLNEKVSAAAKNANASTTIAAQPAVIPPPPNAAMAMSLETIMPRPPTPPPFFASFDTTEEPMAEITIMNDVSAAAPIFMYSKPPAFLLKSTPSAIETVERSFAIDGDLAPADAIAASSDESEKNQANDYVVSAAQTSIRPTVALWIAAMLAIGSGAYLYSEGKKALAPATTPGAASAPATTPVEADEIHSKANSAIRADSGPIAIVRVPRAVLRSAPSTDAPSVQTLERSTAATILDIKDGWMKIESPKIGTATRTAWVRADLVTQLPK